MSAHCRPRRPPIVRAVTIGMATIAMTTDRSSSLAAMLISYRAAKRDEPRRSATRRVGVSGRRGLGEDRARHVMAAAAGHARRAHVEPVDGHRRDRLLGGGVCVLEHLRACRLD